MTLADGQQANHLTKYGNMNSYLWMVREFMIIGVPWEVAILQSLSIKTRTATACSSVRPAFIETYT